MRTAAMPLFLLVIASTIAVLAVIKDGPAESRPAYLDPNERPTRWV
jgi:hypothetical protein